MTDSLFANKTFLLDLIANKVDFNPAKPGIAEIVISNFSNLISL